MACDTLVQQTDDTSVGNVSVGKFSRPYFATKITAAETATICSIKIYCEKFGTPTQTATIGIWGHDAVNDEPEETDIIGTSDSFNCSDMPASASPDWFEFSTGLSASISNTGTYWVVMVLSSSDNSNHVLWHFGGSGTPTRIMNDTDGAAWSAVNLTKILMAELYKDSGVGTNLQLNIGDSWKTVEGVQINIGDSWKTVSGMQINIGDSWKTIF